MQPVHKLNEWYHISTTQVHIRLNGHIKKISVKGKSAVGAYFDIDQIDCAKVVCVLREIKVVCDRVRKTASTSPLLQYLK